MKLIIITLLFTLNAYAEFKVDMIPNDTTQAASYFEKQDEAKAKKHLLKIISKSQWMQGEWKLDEVTPLSKDEEYLDSVDTGETQTITNSEGEEIEVPIYENVEKTRTKYFHPSNFTYVITDITQELADKAAQKAIDDARKDELKAKDKNMKLDELIELLKLKGVI